MNTSPDPSRPRLICRLVRRWHDPDNPAFAWMSRHASECGDCSKYFARLNDLHTELRESSPTAPADVPAGLEDRIWAAVQADQSSRQSTATQSSRRGWSRWSLVPVGLAAVLALVVWNQPGELSVSESEPVAVEFSESDMQQLVTSLGEVTAEWWIPSRDEESAPAPNPLAEEWTALENDATSALRFLERSFLPTQRSAS